MNTQLTRRAFITATGAGLFAPALGEESAKPARIDCQSHLFCPEIIAIMERLDHQTQVLKRGPKNLTRAPSEYLKSVWLDIVSPLPLAMRFAYDFMGGERLLFASDHPWVEPGLILKAFPSHHE